MLIFVCTKLWDLKAYYFLSLIPKPHFLVNLPLQSNYFQEQDIYAVIDYLKRRSDKTNPVAANVAAIAAFPSNSWMYVARGGDYYAIYEDEVSRLTNILLSYYFPYVNGWCIAPEQNAGSNYHPDYTVSRVDLTAGEKYGRAIPHIAVEVKRPVSDGGVSWKVLLNQVWNAADASKHEITGRIWVIGQRGFEICFFIFDPLQYEDSRDYTNFIPLNLNQWSAEDFKHFNIKVKTENIHGQTEVRVIYWRLDDVYQSRYIHDMFIHVSNNMP